MTVRIALSFDNGPEPTVTPHVLDVLAARGVRASFFVLGHKLESEAGKALARRALAEGHVLGNHSYSHEVPLGLDPRPDAVEQEIERTERLLASISAAATRMFRPFGGGGVLGPHLLSPSVVRYLERHEYTCVTWNSVPHDWDDPEGWPGRANAECTEGAHLSLVLHDLPGACLAQLGPWLDAALARGVQFVHELPPECMPLARGVATKDLAAITAAHVG